ncbi:MAG: hypothetical protein V4477_16625 [Pseudomonadota bacterium]
MTEDQIKHMVNRFLSWKLPTNFNPDNGISAKRPNYAPEVEWAPSGTNLFDATQADTMVRYMIEGFPASGPRGAREALNEINTIALGGWSNSYDQDFGTKDNDYKFDCILEQVRQALAALAETSENAHLANGAAELAMKHRDIAEAAVEKLRNALRDLVEATINQGDGGPFEDGEFPELDAARAEIDLILPRHKAQS